jgi:hypothetical protein
LFWFEARRRIEARSLPAAAAEHGRYRVESARAESSLQAEAAKCVAANRSRKNVGEATVKLSS